MSRDPETAEPQSRIEELATEIASRIFSGGEVFRRAAIQRLLIEFAEEISKSAKSLVVAKAALREIGEYHDELGSVARQALEDIGDVTED